MASHKSSTLIIQEMHCLEIIGIRIMLNKWAISETSRKYISVECGRSTRKLIFMATQWACIGHEEFHKLQVHKLNGLIMRPK